MEAAFSGYNVFGATTGNNSGIYPDNVMQGFFYEDFGDTARLTISGLDLTSTYNFNFFGSRIDPPTAVLSSYQIGSTIVTQDPTNNTSRTVQIAGVQPDSTGSILITLYNSNGGRGYLNALTIDGVPSPATYFGGTPVATLAVDTVLATATASRLSLDSTNDLVEKTKVTALPNPFTDAVYLRFELPQPVPRLLVTIVDISGKSIFKQALENLPAGTTTQRLELNARILPAATYFIILQGLPGDRPRSLQLIKMLR